MEGVELFILIMHGDPWWNGGKRSTFPLLPDQEWICVTGEASECPMANYSIDVAQTLE